MLDNEHLLIEQARQDPAAFGALYDHYVDRIFAYTARLMQDDAAAQDVTAVTFEKALKQIRQYQWQAHGFGPWLYRIARNEALSRLRRQKWLSPQSWFGATEMRVTETAVQTRQTRQSIHHALARLRPQDRDIIVLRYLEELPSEAVAEILACSTSNVYVRLHRALERLRTELESEPPAPTKDFTKVAPLNE
ncbi:MAG: sigma-70 family RNA polymerase sigma factor [Ardenticatenaceae bacterium]|nr:sigma-70 family RNA polymerase sigma factor [Ardenticatenaceae bacterium]